MANIESFLKSVALFSTLNDAEIGTLSALVKVRDFQAGAAIVREGDESEELFIVQSGFVNVMRLDEQGQEAFLTTLGAKEYFGEASLFREVKRTATVVATDAVRVVSISRSQFESFMKSNPLSTNRILYAMLQMVFERLSKTSVEVVSHRKGSLSQSAIDRLFI